jgi:hypothetical protein
MLLPMKRSMLILLFALAPLMLIAADISGNWDVTVETDQGSGNPKFTFQQSGEKLTGTYEGLLGKANLTGTVKGDRVEFSFEAKGGPVEGKVTYRGTIESATRMKGDVELAGLGKGTWTGVKR